MDLEEAMFKRRSTREFLSREVETDVINRLMKYAMSGPSAHNKRPWEFYIVRNHIILEKLRNVTTYSYYISPLIIVVAGNMTRTLCRSRRDFWIQDCASSIENILLGATSLGLGSCWCGLAPQEKYVKRVQEILSVEEIIIPMGMVYLGYPAKEVKPRFQYEEERVHFME